MTPSARIAGLIDLLDIVLQAHIPMDVTAGDWFRHKKYIGSKDRAEIAERLYRIMRHRARYSWWLKQSKLGETARNFVLTDCAFHDDRAEERLFDGNGGQYATEALNEEEQAYLKGLHGKSIESDDMPQAVRLEIPDWAEKRMIKRFGDALEDEARAMMQPAGLNLRVNTIKSDRNAAIESLGKDGVTVEPTQFSPHGLQVIGKPYLAKTKAFAKGWVEIQDEGSQLIALACGAKPGMRVLDYCAGGGGKTLALAAEMKNKGSIVAADLDARRLERGRKRYRKADMHNVELRPLQDEQTKKWFKRQKETMDVVLVDAPCSSSGTWRRNPDLRWNFYGPSLEEIKAIQTDILSKVGKCVKVGGRLVYATCSLFEEENEEQIEAFLSQNPDFKVLPLSQALPKDSALPCPDPYLKLSPHQSGTDGFFCAVLIKT